MSEGSSKGFWMSAALHGAAAALLFIFTFVVRSQETEPAKIFELVAGEGDNFMATEAPALGTPGGVTIDLPDPPAPRPEPPAPVVTPAPAPLPPAPKTAPEATPPIDQPVPNFKKAIVRQVIVGESRAKRDIAREKAAEKKRLEAERKRLEEEKKRMTKEEFDRLNKSRGAAPTSKSAPVKVAKIDAEGIAKGVVGGSRNNRTGGAGGKALRNDNDDVLLGYFALFKQRLRTEFEPLPGLSDTLKGTFQVRSNADGSITHARVLRSSGSSEFDQAVLETIRRVRMPPRPDQKYENVEFDFSMRERNEG